MTFTKEMTEELSEMFCRYYEEFQEMSMNYPQFYPEARQMWSHFLDSLGVSETPSDEVLGLEDMVVLEHRGRRFCQNWTIAVPNEVAQKALVLGELPWIF